MYAGPLWTMMLPPIGDMYLFPNELKLFTVRNVVRTVAEVLTVLLWGFGTHRRQQHKSYRSIVCRLCDSQSSEFMLHE